MKTLPEIGEWVFITGSRQIGDVKWKQSFPQNIFGKVIGYEKKLRCTYVMVRCYMKSRSRDRRKIQCHIRTEKKFIKIYKS